MSLNARFCIYYSPIEACNFPVVKTGTWVGLNVYLMKWLDIFYIGACGSHEYFCVIFLLFLRCFPAILIVY